MKIKFTGRDDSRVLDAKDIAKSVEGSEFRKTTFPKNEAVEVPNDAAEAILSLPEIFGQFEAVDEGEQDAPEEQDAPSAKAKGKKTEEASEVTETGAASQSSTPTTRPSGRASTGA